MIVEDMVRPLPQVPTLLASVAQHAKLHAFGTLCPQRHIRAAGTVGRDSEGIPPGLVRHTPTLAPVLLATLLRSKGE
jgi:hypothetical protein